MLGQAEDFRDWLIYREQLWIDQPYVAKRI
jgi:hypothetical protein